MSDPNIQVAETIQTASLNRNLSPAHDVNPSASTSEKQPAVRTAPSEAPSIPSDIVDASRMIRPVSRHRNLPPLPDLRFEQSYLASLRGAETWGRVAWITIRDQVFLPLIQGTLWTLALSGWRYWNRSTALSGRSLGSRVRKWWYEVNNWELPPATSRRVFAQMQNNYSAHF